MGLCFWVATSAAVAQRTTHWNAVVVLLADALSLGLALLERVLVLELGAHGDVVDVAVGRSLCSVRGSVQALRSGCSMR